MNQLQKQVVAQVTAIIVSAVVTEALHEVIHEFREKRADSKKNPIGFVPNDEKGGAMPDKIEDPEDELKVKLNEARAYLNRMVDEEIERTGKKDVPINRIIVLKRILWIYRDDEEAKDQLTNTQLGIYTIKNEIISEFEKEVRNDFA
jgi:hypothetical protein